MGTTWYHHLHISWLPAEKPPIFSGWTWKILWAGSQDPKHENNPAGPPVDDLWAWLMP